MNAASAPRHLSRKVLVALTTLLWATAQVAAVQGSAYLAVLALAIAFTATAALLRSNDALATLAASTAGVFVGWLVGQLITIGAFVMFHPAAGPAAVTALAFGALAVTETTRPAPTPVRSAHRHLEVVR